MIIKNCPIVFCFDLSLSYFGNRLDCLQIIDENETRVCICVGGKFKDTINQAT